MGTKPRLSPNADKVLRYLYDTKGDADGAKVQKIVNGTRIDADDVRVALNELQECGFVNGPPSLLAQVTSILAEMDDKFGPTSEHFSEAVILLASALIGANDVALAKELGFDLEFVRLVGARLRASRIWIGDELNPAYRTKWDDDEGGIAFWMAVTVAGGDLQIVGGTDENPQFQMTDSGKTRAVSLIKRIGEDGAP